jgi:hypothetical protein
MEFFFNIGPSHLGILSPGAILEFRARNIHPNSKITAVSHKESFVQCPDRSGVLRKTSYELRLPSFLVRALYVSTVGDASMEDVRTR